jgi:exodeoxyribonuclease VII large subunit
MSESSTYITVSELTFAIKNQLESRFSTLNLQGEISNAKLHSSGHLYFDLKDAGAKISAVCFKPHYQQLSRPPKEGDQVIVKGSLSVYPPHGKYQLIVRQIQYLGIGELLLKLEALKKKLQALGWFDKEKKKPLPKFARTIGVVTSPTGAVIRDIIHVLKRRFSGFHLILNPVRVQGVEAVFEIAKAIEEFNKYQLADVLIVCRGGGSLEDLWAFNEELVAKAIFESKIPIVSAVGHETDTTIADFVADVRAPTPSAAAEIVSAEKAHHLNVLIKTQKNLSIALSHQLARVRTQLKSYERSPLFATPFTLLAEPMQKLDEIKSKLDTKIREGVLKRQFLLSARKKQAGALKPTSLLTSYKLKMHQLERRLNDRFSHTLEMKKLTLREVMQKLRSVDPKNVLKRGYAILFAEKEGSVIVSTQQLTPGQNLRAQIFDGEASVTVNSVNNDRR